MREGKASVEQVCLRDQRGGSYIQALILLSLVALGALVAFKELGASVSSKARCTGDAIANLTTGRCAGGEESAAADAPPGEAPAPDREREIEWGDVPQVDHTARPAPPVSSEAEEWGAVTDYIAGEVAANADSWQADLLWLQNEAAFWSPIPGDGVSSYPLWVERVGPGRPWDHKGAIQNAYGLSTPVPGKEGEISWDIWSNIHYGIIGLEAGFSPAELMAGAWAADKFKRNPGDELAIRIGMELYEEHGKDVTAEQIQQAVIDHYDEFGRAGKVYGDPKYIPEGWDSPYAKDE
jgi:hypothetical protein